MQFMIACRRQECHRVTDHSARLITESWNSWQVISEKLFEMTSLCTNTGIDSLLPLVNYVVYYILLEASLRAHEPVPQICHVLYWRLLDSFLHHSRNAVISRIKVSALRRPHVGSNEFGSLTTKQFYCLTWTMNRCVVLLRDVNFMIDVSDNCYQHIQ